MKQEIIKFIENNRICVLSTQRKDLSPHGATVHFAFSEKLNVFYVLTDSNYNKCELLKIASSCNASMVIGFDERDMRTIQFDGTAYLLSDNESIQETKEIYFKKFPEKKKWENEINNAWIKFIPNWYQWSNYNIEPNEKVSENL